MVEVTGDCPVLRLTSSFVTWAGDASIYIYVHVCVMSHRHGDLLFLDMDQDTTSSSEISSMESTPTLTSTHESSSTLLSSILSRPSFTSRDVVADSVDQFLWNQDGKIPRQRNEQL